MTLHTLLHGVVLLSLPWLALEVGTHLLERHVRSANVWLPLLHLYTRLQQAATASNASGTSITRGSLWIKVETCAFNAVPASALAKLGIKSTDSSQCTIGEETDGNRRALTTWLSTLYDVGVLFAFAAFLSSLAIIAWGAFILIGDIVDLAGATDKLTRDGIATTDSTLAKRAVSLLQKRSAGTTASTQAASWAPKLTPLIPGLTLPWSHLLPLALALSITQVIHEAGHAVCGALHDLHALRMGVMLLFPAIPGAFVVLPEGASRVDEGLVRHFDDDGEDEDDSEEAQGGASDYRCTQDRLRIISAGVWHNALTFIVVGVLLALPAGRVAHNLFWRDAGGIRVFHVARSSPLSQHLSPGMLVTHLDDVDLRISSDVDAERRAMLWDAYLSYTPLPDAERADTRGWYVSTSEWAALPTSCCDKYSGNTSSTTAPDNMLCYISDDGVQGRCYDPTRLVDGRQRVERCSGSRAKAGEKASGVKDTRICIFPDDREQLLRITVPSSRQTDERPRVVLFQGNRYAVHLALHASPYDFRFGRWLWPRRMFEWCGLVVRYTFTLSVAMALFNMLPLPSLDGDVFLLMLLMSWGAAGDVAVPQDQEAGRSSDGGYSPHTRLNGRSDEEQTSDASSLRRPTNGEWRSRRFDTDQRVATHKAYHPRDTNRRRDAGLLRFVQRPAWLAGRTSKRPWHTQTLKQVHARIRWTTTALAVFVMGGSIVLHVVQAGDV